LPEIYPFSDDRRLVFSSCCQFLGEYILNGRIKLRAAAVTSGLLLTAAGVGSTAAGASAAATHNDYRVGASSSRPLPATVKPGKVPNSTATAVPYTNTPNGFKLIHPGHRRSNYTYDSDKVYQGSYHCSGGVCRLAGEVTVQLHEHAIGGSSHTWQLTVHMKEYENPGHLSWSYFATYWCGVNVKGGNDYECKNGAAPSHASMSHNTVVNKPWGKTNSITVFPMVQATTQFSNGVKDTTKFRGWDTLSRKSTTRLNTKSGTGN